MARENRRKREERRFGKPERLADRIIAQPDMRQWAYPYAANGVEEVRQYELFQPVVDTIAVGLASCPVLTVDNVCRLYWDSPKDHWRYTEDFPNSAPPFPLFFVESLHPGTMSYDGGRKVSRMNWCPDQWGAMFWAESRLGMDFEVWDEDFEPTPYPPVGVRVSHFEGACWEMRCLVVGYREGLLGILPAEAIFPIGGRGDIIADPVLFVAEMTNSQDMKEAGSMFHSLLRPLLLSFSFLHCRNVVRTAVEPDRAVNRERRKAGLKPFVRYHTINIEPMKKVLRTEGGVATHGFQKALHICRGHFATYTEEKPLFGRVAGTFWVPAHVRGSIKEGVVMSDYRVNAPPE